MSRAPQTRTGNDHDEAHAPHDPRDEREDVVRDMVRRDRADHPMGDRVAGTTASADAVESLRRGLKDLKHDVRMLKVGLDKQGQLLQYIATTLDRRDQLDRGGNG